MKLKSEEVYTRGVGVEIVGRKGPFTQTFVHEIEIIMLFNNGITFEYAHIEDTRGTSLSFGVDSDCKLRIRNQFIITVKREYRRERKRNSLLRSNYVRVQFYCYNCESIIIISCKM